MNCLTNAFKASIWLPNNVRVIVTTFISGPVGTPKFFLITVVIDLAKASLASRSDVFSSWSDDVRRMTDTCSTDVEARSTGGAAATTFCSKGFVWGAVIDSKGFGGTGTGRIAGTCFAIAGLGFLTTWLQNQKPKRHYKKKGNQPLEVFGRDLSSLCDNSHLWSLLSPSLA